MRKSFKVFSVRGIGIYVNWSWLLAIAFITWSLGTYYHQHFPQWNQSTDYIVGLISGLLLFVTVLLHELAHSFTAKAYGLPVNTITLFIFGGVASLTREPTTPRMELLIAVAGPATSLALAGSFFLLHLAASAGPSQINAVLVYLASINLILALFNLIPGFPLDGGRVFRAAVWWGTGNLRRATQIASSLGQGIGFLFLVGGVVMFVRGNTFGGISLAFVGWFLTNAASSSYQQIVMDEVLRGVEVQDVMDAAPPAAYPQTTIDQIVYHYLLNQNQRAVPVNGADGRLEGLVTMSDIRAVDRDDWPTTHIRDVMTPAPKLSTVMSHQDLRRAMQIMAEHDYHQLPVIENGNLIGMLNRGHVLQYLHVKRELSRQS